MKIILTESQLSELVLDLKYEDKGNYYSPDLNILSTQDFDYKSGYYSGHKGTRYIVGEDNPMGEFRFPHVDGMTPGFDLYDNTSRNWHRCISMLGPIMKDFIDNHYSPSAIIFSPDGEQQRKRYQSKELIDYILGYIGNKYHHTIQGNNVIYIKK